MKRRKKVTMFTGRKSQPTPTPPQTNGKMLVIGGKLIVIGGKIIVFPNKP